MRNRGRSSLLALTGVMALAGVACGEDGSGSSSSSGGTSAGGELVLYSGRDEELVAPLIDAFEEQSGIDVEVRYGNSAELGAALLEEGGNTPADVVYSQEVGALGVLSDNDLLSPLPTQVVDLVDDRFAPAEGTDWVGVTGRSRVLVVNPEVVGEVPDSVDDLTDPQYREQIGWAPSNASFQAFVTAFRVSRGEGPAADWLDAMIENEPQSFESNSDVLEAVDTGELGIGLINHYYWHQLKAEKGDDVTAELVYLDPADPGALLNVAGVGILASAEDQEAAAKVAAFLVGEEAQRYFAEETAEYPVVAGITSPFDLAPVDASAQAGVDLNDLDSLADTQELLRKVGLI